MQGVTVVDHPLVQHKLTLMREVGRSTKGFRQLLNEIGMLLCYEVTRDLPTEMVEVETPMAKMQAPILAGKKLVLAPILRAGVGFLDGMLELVPSARVAHIGLYRDPATLVAVEYYFKAPHDLHDRLVIVLSRSWACHPCASAPSPLGIVFVASALMPSPPRHVLTLALLAGAPFPFFRLGAIVEPCPARARRRYRWHIRPEPA